VSRFLVTDRVGGPRPASGRGKITAVTRLQQKKHLKREKPLPDIGRGFSTTWGKVSGAGDEAVR